MHSHDLISVSVGEIRPNGQGNLSIILGTAAGEILLAYSAGAHIDIIIPGVGPRGSIPRAARLTAVIFDGNLRRADRHFHRRLTLYLHQQLKAGRSARHFAAARTIFPAAGRALPAVCRGGTGITPLLAMAEADCRQKGALELHSLCRQLAPDQPSPAPEPADRRTARWPFTESEEGAAFPPAGP